MWRLNMKQEKKTCWLRGRECLGSEMMDS
ncbi:hypothetical protein CSHISOI_06497 [Colletotrichum shisoi]|uniref:Uncharacterized protein n=1 Tax=Colletotrichum shisoi TaxID=2078593 RepID=A0A5Q4BPR2_9PEZI|nr:hypothetical protein CSHISOI_06497 [Colletotrichum shisoi]